MIITHWILDKADTSKDVINDEHISHAKSTNGGKIAGY